MKRVIISILVLFSLASFSLVPAFAQLPNLSLYQAAEKTQFRLKLEAGKQYYMQTITEQQISDPTPAKEETTVMTVGTGAKLDVSNIDTNGNAQVTYTYKWIKIGIKVATEEKVYDSSKKDSTISPELQWFAPLLEESFSLTITPEGRISEIKGLDKVRSNVRQKLPQGPMQEVAMSSLNQWLDDQTLREGIENSMAIYPDKPVGVGDSWSRNIAYSSGTAMILDSKWTLKERRNGVAIIEVVSTVKPNPEAKPVEIGSSEVTSSAEFTGNQQGLIEMQESTGLIIRSKINQQISGQNKITRPGVPDKITPMDITGVLTLEISNWEKARSNFGTQTVAQEPTRRETSYSRPENPQRRANISAAASTSPYLIDDLEGSRPSRPGSGSEQQTSNKTLHEAAATGDITQVQLLLSQGTDINLLNLNRTTPLHIAILNRKKEIAELLVNNDANLNKTNKRGLTPLHVASTTGQKEIVELLISKGADVNIMVGRENALTLAKKKNYTEIIDVLDKNGATEPAPMNQGMMEDRYYAGGDNLYSSSQEQTNTSSRYTRGRGSRAATQPVEVDILADPNEIIARIKTFAGLQKVLDDLSVSVKSKSETRQWQQTRYDNRTMLVRSVQAQFEDEMKFINTVSVSEKATKTTEAIASAVKLRQERFKAISKELMALRREQRETQQTSTRGRGRTSGRSSTRGRSSQNEQQYNRSGNSGSYGRSGGSGSYGRNSSDPYNRGGTSARTSRGATATRRPSQQAAQPVDRGAEDESRQWLQASFEDKSDLAQAVNDQIKIEVISIRDVAVEEAAKKTTAAIDGLLLARQMRLDAFFIKMQEQAQRQQSQDPRARGGYQQDSRYNTGGATRGGTTRGGARGSTRGGTTGTQQNTRRRR